MIGVRMVNGIARTRTKIGISAKFSITVTKFATYIDPIRPHTKSGCSANKSGPGRNPQIIMPPSRIAVVGDPGMPRVIIGSIEPVEAALFAASGAATPAIFPFPKLSGSLEKVLASPYDISEAGVAPAAGNVPTKKPNIEPRLVVAIYDLIFVKLSKKRAQVVFTFWTCTEPFVVSSVHSISPIP